MHEIILLLPIKICLFQLPQCHFNLESSSHHQTSKTIYLNADDVGEQSNPWLPWCWRVVDRVWTVRGWKCKILEYGHSIHIRHDWSISGKRVHNREPECHESTPEPYCTAACCVIYKGVLTCTYCASTSTCLLSLLNKWKVFCNVNAQKIWATQKDKFFLL